MHDRRLIRHAVRDRLEQVVGPDAPEGLGFYADRAAGFADAGETGLLNVAVANSGGDLVDQQASDVFRTYVVTVQLAIDGLASDLDVDSDEPSCPDLIDDLALKIEGALKRNDVLDREAPALGFLPVNWEFVDDQVAFKPGGRGQVGNLFIRYALTLRQLDGAPTRS
ncbi:MULTISPECIES: hypothetical protein [unclassified Methylobacterium]|uniref:hypothetical protein n=1 Tax=unclassified Methylobacterium TaxID=2615210 RepID=UPI001353FE83|nr:hypothetical protein [Methylobacterium sp. 2A]MWV22458.1 hypothetical protein [Methylobacterium sp. 2A]